jgi:phosphoribosylglycinamide formyltransferase-1
MPEQRDKRRVAVLISGRGSNMRALVEQAKGYEVVLVASNKQHDAGHALAREREIPNWTWDSRGIDKAVWEAALEQSLMDHRIGTIALAGFMRILSPEFSRRWSGRILNIHPSLLPKYRGLDTHKRAIDAGDPVSGCSVHLVTEELDSGDVLAQAEVPILAGDTEATLEARVLAVEHQLYPKTLAEFVAR